MNQKGFLKAIGDVKKQVNRQNQKLLKQQKEKEKLQLSSDQEKKLEEMGAIRKTKKIQKITDKWSHDKHDKYNQSVKKAIPNKESWTIEFSVPQQYKTILAIVKNHKAFIEQLSQKKIILTLASIYEECLELFKKAGISYKLKEDKKEEQKIKVQKSNENINKPDIFNRII